MLKYLIIGAGGVGGTLGAYLQRAGLSVSFLAHGKTLEALKKKGLTIVGDEGEETLAPVAAFDEADYSPIRLTVSCRFWSALPRKTP